MCIKAATQIGNLVTHRTTVPRRSAITLSLVAQRFAFAQGTGMKCVQLLIGIAISGAAAAQHNHGGMQSPGRTSSMEAPRPAVDAQPLFFDGEVRAIDKHARTLTLVHGPIRILDMPAATGAYPVKEAAMLDEVQIGSKVRFTAVLQGGVFVVTRVLPAD